MLTTNLNIHSLINEFTKEDMRRAKVLEGLGIDACCGGNKSLAKACGEKGLDPEAVLKKLVLIEEEEDSANGEDDWSKADLADLVAHIENTHHAYLKKVLPYLSSLIEKVVEAHGKRHPELLDLKKTFALLRADLEPHMMKEERVLFSMVRQMESGVPLQEFQCGLQGPIRVMRAEHQRVDNLQVEISKLTNNFTLRLDEKSLDPNQEVPSGVSKPALRGGVPEDGCGTYRLMLEELKNLDTDLNIHIYKENEILFSRILNVETNLV